MSGDADTVDTVEFGVGEAARSGDARSRRRATMMNVKKTFFGMPRDRHLSDELTKLVDSYDMAQQARAAGAHPVGRLGEGRALVLIGASGAGKTRSLERLLYKGEAFPGYGREGETCKLLSIEAPSPSTLGRLGRELLLALGYPLQRELKENVIWELVRRQLRQQEVSFVHIDEIQCVIQSRNSLEIARVRDTLKNLMQQVDWPVWLILSGLSDIDLLFKGDNQLLRRCRFVRFPALSFERDTELVRRLIRHFAADHGKLNVDAVSDDETISRLLHAALYQCGTTIEYVQDAVEAALSSDADALSVDHFATTYSARSGCSPESNVFLVPNDWLEITVERALDWEGEDPDGVDETPQKRVRRKRKK